MMLRYFCYTEYVLFALFSNCLSHKILSPLRRVFNEYSLSIHFIVIMHRHFDPYFHSKSEHLFYFLTHGLIM